jgi:hypothetical protein
MKELTDSEVIAILSMTLLQQIYFRAEEQLKKTNTVGIVYSAKNLETNEDESFVIKYKIGKDDLIDEWAIIPIEDKKYNNGDIIYFEET